MINEKINLEIYVPKKTFMLFGHWKQIFSDDRNIIKSLNSYIEN